MDTAIRVIMYGDTMPRIELHEEFGNRKAAYAAAKHMHRLVPQYTHADVVDSCGLGRTERFRFESERHVTMINNRD